MLRITRLGLIAGALTAALAVGACGGGDTGRAGGKPAGKTTVLKLANANGQADELQLFIDQVDKLSDGRLRIKRPMDGAGARRTTRRGSSRT